MIDLEAIERNYKLSRIDYPQIGKLIAEIRLLREEVASHKSFGVYVMDNYDKLKAEHEKSKASLETISELKFIINHQANMKSMWPLSGSTMGEHLLSSALRHLHAVIEGDKLIALISKQNYWDLESEV